MNFVHGGLLCSDIGYAQPGNHRGFHMKRILSNRLQHGRTQLCRSGLQELTQAKGAR